MMMVMDTAVSHSLAEEKIRTDNEENVLFIIYLLPYGGAIKVLLIYTMGSKSLG